MKVVPTDTKGCKTFSNKCLMRRRPSPLLFIVTNKSNKSNKMLIFTISCLVIAILCLLFVSYDEDWGFGTMIFGTIMISCLIAIPINRYTIKDEVKGIEAIQLTLDQQRKKNITEYERATLTISILEWNNQIAKRTNRNTLWRSGLWIPKEWDNVEPIK